MCPNKTRQRRMNQHWRMPIDRIIFACCIGSSPVTGDEVLAALGQFEVANEIPRVRGGVKLIFCDSGIRLDS